MLKLNNYRAALDKAMRRGSIGFAESYIEGDIDSRDLTAVFRFFLHNRELFDEAAGRGLVQGLESTASRI